MKTLLPFRIFVFLCLCVEPSFAAQTDAFIESLEEPVQSVNPFKFSGVPAYHINLKMAEYLLERDERGNFEPNLAEAWEISPDGKAYTFHLRKDVKFSDGTPVTAADVKFTIEAYRDPKYEAIIWAPLFEKIKSITIVNDRTVRIETSEAKFSILRNLATYLRVFSKRFYEKTPPEEWNEKFVGTGPYILDHMEKRRRIYFRKNPDWWGRKDPKLRDTENFEAITVRFVNEPTAALELIQNGELDVYTLSGNNDAEKVKSMPGFGKTIRLVEDTSFSGSRVWGANFNLKNPLFINREVRRALNMLWNRALVNEKIFSNSMKLSTAEWPDTESFSLPTKAIPYDPGQALKILKAAGWNSSEHILFREENGKRVEFQFTIKYSQRELEPMLTSYVEDAKKIGIAVALEYLDPSLSWKIGKEGRYDVMAGVNFYKFGEILSESYATNGSYNNIGFSNPAVDKIFESLDREFDAKKRLHLQQKIFRMITDEVLGIYGFETNKRYYAVSSRVEIPKDPKKTEQRYWRLKAAAPQ